MEAALPSNAVHSLISRILPVPSGSARSDSGTIQLICLLVITGISVVWVLLKLAAVLVPLTFAVFLAFLIEPVLSRITLVPQDAAALYRRTRRRCRGSACGAEGLSAAVPAPASGGDGDLGGGGHGTSRAVVRGPRSGDVPTASGGDVEAATPFAEKDACAESDRLCKPKCHRCLARWLQGLWDLLAIVLCVCLIFGFLYAIVAGLVKALTEFDWGKYQNSGKIQEIQELLSKLGVDLNEILSGAIFQRYRGEVVSVALKAVGVLESILLTLLLFIFVCAAMLPGIHQRKPRSRMKILMQRYLFCKTIASFIIAVAVMFSLWIMKVDLILIFAIVTFILNYIPNIGSFFAILAPVPLVALEPQSDISKVILVAVVPFVVHNALGNIIEPKLMSQGLDLHPLTVVVALTFWGSMWGIAGAVLSVPITCVIRLWLEETDHPYAKAIHRFFDSPMDAHHKSEIGQETSAARAPPGRVTSSSTVSTSTTEVSPGGVAAAAAPRHDEQLGA